MEVRLLLMGRMFAIHTPKGLNPHELSRGLGEYLDDGTGAIALVQLFESKSKYECTWSWTEHGVTHHARTSHIAAQHRAWIRDKRDRLMRGVKRPVLRKAA